MKYFFKAPIIVLGLFYLSCGSTKKATISKPIITDTLLFYMVQYDRAKQQELQTVLYKSGWCYRKSIETCVLSLDSVKLDAGVYEQIKQAAQRLTFYDLNDKYLLDKGSRCSLEIFLRHHDTYTKKVESDCTGPKPLLLFTEECRKIIFIK